MKVIKVGRWRWLGELLRMQEQKPCRKLTLRINQRALDEWVDLV
jgi:hypothetical protein